jgi:hypothetical protein
MTRRKEPMGEFLKEFFQFVWQRKKFWLYPMLISLVLLALLTFFAGSSAVSPFIYTMF